MTRRLLLVALLVAATSLAVSVVGPVLQLAVIDESQFPTPAAHLAGALVYGSDAGSVYVNDGTEWSRLAGGGGVAIYGDTRSDPVRRCAFVDWSNTATSPVNYGLNAGSSGTFGVFDAGAAFSAVTRHVYLVTSGANGIIDGNNVAYWRGTGPDEGGFTFWSRWAIEAVQAGTQIWAGMFQDSVSGGHTLMTDVGPVLNTAQYQSRIIFLCRGGGENLKVCAGTSRFSATCTDLGASFPCENGAYYDTSLIVEPVSDTNVLGAANYYVTNLGTGASTNGAVDGLPDAGLRFLSGMGASHTGGLPGTRFAFYEMCMTSRL